MGAIFFWSFFLLYLPGASSKGLAREHCNSPYEIGINDRGRQKALNSAVNVCKEVF